MDYVIAGIALVLLLAWAVATGRSRHRRLEELGSLPPGPRPWPVVGNLFQLAGSAAPPHQSFAKIAQKHGPIMTLHLGSMTTVVISSSAAARVMFKHHDAALAGRKIYESMKGDVGSAGSLITTQHGPHWRTLRRLCTSQFFAAAPLDATRGVRARCVDQMVEWIAAAARGGDDGCVDVGRFFFLMAFNLIGNLIFSKDLVEADSERGAEFFYHAGKATEYAGRPNVADFVPAVRWADPQGIRRRTQFHVKRAFDIAGGFLRERMMMREKDERERKRDYLDVLLEYRGGNGEEGGDGFSSTVINVIVFEMFTAGTDTTTSTLEWAMAELLRHPDKLRRAQTELRALNPPGKNLEEHHLDLLPYLNAVIKETLRLHPPLPFLVPHKALEPCKILGFRIPKETQILVNVWAIGRDPRTWTDPEQFEPERFLDPGAPDYRGHHFEYMPFGSGRRMCPAVPLAARVLPLALGAALHSFDWALAGGGGPGRVDMRERMGITLRKDVPLRAVPSPYIL